MRAVVGIGGWDGGSIAVDGVDLSRHPKAARARVGYMPERISLPAEVRVQRFLRFAAASKGLRGREAHAAVEFVLEAVGIQGEWRRRLVGNLSKGFRQRVGLAQAIVGTPPLLVIDEPLSGLDPLNLSEVGESIRNYAGGGRAVLISTHQLTQARALADRVVVVSQGQVLYDGPIGSMSLGPDGSASVRLGLTGHGGALGVEEVLAGVGGSQLVDKASNGNGQVDLRLELGHEALVGELVRAFVHKGWTVRYLERITDPLEIAFRNAVQGTGSPAEIGAVPGRSE
jgi:ABC-2 type transport system ATP-binding protein